MKENLFFLKDLLESQRIKFISTWLQYPDRIISDLKGEEIVGTVYKKDLLETNQKEFRVENLKKEKK